MFKPLTLLIAALLLATAAPALGQDAQSTPATTPAAQLYCPVTTDEKIDPEIFTDYKGKRVFFCCDKCKAKFVRDPERYVSRVAGFSEPSASHQEHEHADTPHEHGHDEAPGSEHAAHGATEQEHHHDEVMPPEHDHAAHGPSTGPRWQKWLGGFHPPMVNFPIGVLTAGALAEMLFMLRRRTEFDHVARFCVVFAVVTGLTAAVLGWLFAGIRLTDTDNLLAIHRWLGTGTALWFFALLWASERARRPEHPSRSLYRFLLFGGTLLVTATGFFGGAMVYGLDHYLWR